MDKVIDGVDVSECEHYRAEIETKMPYGEYEILKDKCHYSGIEVIQNCKGNKGCIYKQLKRLQAENERLKEELNRKDDLINDITNGGIQLQKECERLKEENKQLKKLKFKSDGIELLQDANLNLHNANVKYRQALQEIRDIVSEPCIVDENCQTCNSGCMHKDILNKINSVIGAE